MPLSPHEKQVLDLLCDGRKDKEIARTLHCAETTVRAYVRLIKAKLDCETRVEAVLKYDREQRVKKP